MSPLQHCRPLQARAVSWRERHGYGQFLSVKETAALAGRDRAGREQLIAQIVANMRGLRGKR